MQLKWRPSCPSLHLQYICFSFGRKGNDFAHHFHHCFVYSQEMSHSAAWAMDPHQRLKTKRLPPRRLQSRKTWRPRCLTRCRTIPPERSASFHPSSFFFRLPWKQHRQGHTLSQSSQSLLHYCMKSWLNQGLFQHFSLLGSVLEKAQKISTQLGENAWKMATKNRKWATFSVLADGWEWHGEACRTEAGGGKNITFATEGFHEWAFNFDSCCMAHWQPTNKLLHVENSPWTSPFTRSSSGWLGRKKKVTWKLSIMNVALYSREGWCLTY